MNNEKHIPMPFSAHIGEKEVCAIYEGKVFYRMETLNPTLELLLMQSRIAQYHPLRDPNFKGVFYMDAKNQRIESCRVESEVPSGCYLYHNWHLNNHMKEDKRKGIHPLNK